MNVGRGLRWLAVASCVMASVGYAGQGLDQVRARGVLRWGGDLQGGEPYVFQDPAQAGHLIGFEVEIADGVARRLGLEAQFVQNDWQHLVPSLLRGDFDIILNGLEVTPGRRQEVAFTRPYCAFDEVLMVRREAGGVRTLGDLSGQRVGTLSGSLALDIVRGAPGVEPVLYEGVEEPYLDLEHGRVSGVVLDHLIARRYGMVRPTLRVAAVVGRGEYAIGVRPGEPELLRAVDDALAAMDRDGELRAIRARWGLGALPAFGVGAPTADGRPAAPGRFTAAHARLFVQGAAVTVVISALAMLLAMGGGFMLSVARRHGGPLVAGGAAAYVEIFRGTPVLLQLYVLYYGLAPVLTLNAFAAAVIGLGLNYAAYESELYRAGMQAVPQAQTEAALALGMSRVATLRWIVLPQAARVALPGIANDFIALLKDSSLVSVITVVELTKQMTITAVDVRSWVVPGCVCAGLYLAMSYPLGRLARRLERRLGSVTR